MIGNIIEAFKMVFTGNFSAGSIMVVGGCLLFVITVPIFITSFGRFAKQRKKKFDNMQSS